MTERDRPDEQRVPLYGRLTGGAWTDFEARLFNLLTEIGPKIPGYFSNRLRVTQVMLEAMDAEIAVIRAERAMRDIPDDV